MKKLLLIVGLALISLHGIAVTLNSGDRIDLNISGTLNGPSRTQLLVNTPSGIKIYDLGAPLEFKSKEYLQLDLDIQILNSALKSGQSVNLSAGNLSEVVASARVIKSQFSRASQIYIQGLEGSLELSRRDYQYCVDNYGPKPNSPRPSDGRR